MDSETWKGNEALIAWMSPRPRTFYRGNIDSLDNVFAEVIEAPLLANHKGLRRRTSDPKTTSSTRKRYAILSPVPFSADRPTSIRGARVFVSRCI